MMMLIGIEADRRKGPSYGTIGVQMSNENGGNNFERDKCSCRMLSEMIMK